MNINNNIFIAAYQLIFITFGQKTTIKLSFFSYYNNFVLKWFYSTVMTIL